MAWRSATAIALALLGACAPGAAPRAGPMTVLGTTTDVDALVRAALTHDATLDRAADSLYAPEAVVIANARLRFAAPRFAGVSYGGRVTVAAAAVTLQGGWAWAVVDYRWIGAQQAEAGRATFVVVRRPAGWRIIHAHSSGLR
jgi:hypothetical protein